MSRATSEGWCGAEEQHGVLTDDLSQGSDRNRRPYKVRTGRTAGECDGAPFCTMPLTWRVALFEGESIAL
jgi:hypothetical protein